MAVKGAPIDSDGKLGGNSRRGVLGRGSRFACAKTRETFRRDGAKTEQALLWRQLEQRIVPRDPSRMCLS